LFTAPQPALLQQQAPPFCLLPTAPDVKSQSHDDEQSLPLEGQQEHFFAVRSPFSLLAACDD